MRADLAEIWEAAIAAVDPERLVARCIDLEGGRVRLRVGRERLVRRREALFVAGAGKAAVAMARAIARVLPEASGVVVAPRAAAGRGARSSAARLGRIRVARGEHPVPGAGSFAATRLLVGALRRAPRDATVLLLLSGGASALLAMPARGIRRRDKVLLNRRLLRAGLAVGEMNVVRKHVSAVKGGGLARLAAPREVITLAISDVAGDSLAIIGSGPAAGDPSRHADALAILERRLGAREVPAAVLRRLRSGRDETAKPDHPAIRRARAAVVGSNRVARAAAAARARELGYDVVAARRGLAGAAAACGARLVAALPRRPRRATAVIAGGETVVDARGAPGKGGRSQELALAAARHLPGTGWTLLAAGTDGIDGETPAAGAVVDGGTLGHSGGAAVAEALSRHDSHGYFSRHGGLWVTGPTGTNVMDLVIAVHPGASARAAGARGRPAATAARARRGGRAEGRVVRRARRGRASRG